MCSSLPAETLRLIETQTHPKSHTKLKLQTNCNPCGLKSPYSLQMTPFLFVTDTAALISLCIVYFSRVSPT